MNRNNLTPRLRAIVDQVLPCETAIDVGCDHAQVGIWLVNNCVVKHMTESDINLGPIERARYAVARAGLQEKIECIQCDGLCGVPAQDTVIIAGLGGELICEILKRAEWTRKNECRMVLQPMTAGEDLRRFLFENGYTIIKETIAREHEKYYVILTVVPGTHPSWDETALYLSEMSDPQAAEYLKRVIKRLYKVLNGKLAAASRDEEEISALKRLIRALEGKCNDDAKGI